MRSMLMRRQSCSTSSRKKRSRRGWNRSKDLSSEEVETNTSRGTESGTDITGMSQGKKRLRRISSNTRSLSAYMGSLGARNLCSSTLRRRTTKKIKRK